VKRPSRRQPPRARRPPLSATALGAAPRVDAPTPIEIVDAVSGPFERRIDAPARPRR